MSINDHYNTWFTQGFARGNIITRANNDDADLLRGAQWELQPI